MSFTFKVQELAKVCQACLEGFSDNIEITELITAHQEIVMAGKNKYECAQGMRFLTNNEYGFKILATAASADMMSTIIEMAQKINDACKAGQWDVVSRNTKKIQDMNTAITNWRLFWKIENSEPDKINLSVIYRDTYFST